jgi:uncharacterized protein (DUF305 family)
MMPNRILNSALLSAAALALFACSAAPQPAVVPQPAPPVADSHYPFVQADVDFMSNMISHHAQAITVSKWAPTHGASPALQTLAARIINAQRDEIGSMQRWLRDRNLPVPEPDTIHGTMATMPSLPAMPGMAEPNHVMLMPGMLTQDQMQQLDAARGDTFDRLFLTDMIQHHTGAVSMVKQLFASEGAAQDQTVFKFASDVNVDQTTEIARMRKMLDALMFEGSTQ